MKMITKGEWMLNTNKTQVLDEKGQTIAHVSPYAAESALQRDANAQAIAAVPDMIEALQDVKELIGNGIAIINDNAPSGTQAEISTVYSKILQALAKAGIK
jgi:hypothetical protein